MVDNGNVNNHLEMEIVRLCTDINLSKHVTSECRMTRTETTTLDAAHKTSNLRSKMTKVVHRDYSNVTLA